MMFPGYWVSFWVVALSIVELEELSGLICIRYNVSEVTTSPLVRCPSIIAARSCAGFPSLLPGAGTGVFNCGGKEIANCPTS
jgi:hypothetical protein